MNLYVVKDGIESASIRSNGIRIFGTDYYSITSNFKSNDGYIRKKAENYWRLYTQIGQKWNQSRYHKHTSFEDCVKKLKELKGNEDVFIINQSELSKISDEQL